MAARSDRRCSSAIQLADGREPDGAGHAGYLMNDVEQGFGLARVGGGGGGGEHAGRRDLSGKGADEGAAHLAQRGLGVVGRTIIGIRG